MLAAAFLAIFTTGFMPASAAKNPAVSLYLNKNIYKAGQPIGMTVIAANKGKKTIRSIYGSSQNFDFAVYDKSKKKIWQWSHGKVFAMAVRPFELLPGQKIKSGYIWKQEDNNGRSVKPGKYYIEGSIALSPRVESPRKPIIIK